MIGGAGGGWRGIGGARLHLERLVAHVERVVQFLVVLEERDDRILRERDQLSERHAGHVQDREVDRLVIDHAEVRQSRPRRWIEAGVEVDDQLDGAARTERLERVVDLVVVQVPRRVL